jgi:hypothetical protein
MLPQRYAKLSSVTLTVYSTWFLFIAYAKTIDDSGAPTYAVTAERLWISLLLYAVFMLLFTLCVWRSYPCDARTDAGNVRGARQVLLAQWGATLSIGVWGALFFEDTPSYFGAGVAIGFAFVFLVLGGMLVPVYTAAPTPWSGWLPSLLWFAALASVTVPAYTTEQKIM